MASEINNFKNDITDYSNAFKLKYNNLYGYAILFLQIVLAILFFPVLLCVLISKNENIMKIIKQIAILLYCVFLCIFIYSLVSFKSYLNTNIEKNIAIPFQDKIRSFENGIHK